MKRNEWFVKFDGIWVHLGMLSDVADWVENNVESVQDEPALFKCQLMTEEEVTALPEADL